MELVMEHLTKQFDEKKAVDGFCAALRPGITGLLGPNGSGKTTLMRLLCTILSPTGGDIRLDGVSIAALGARYRARLGYLPQDFGFYPSFTAEEFLLYMSAVKGLPLEFARRESRRLLELVHLSGERKKKIRAFSGGMKQRLGLAQALLGSPEVLILDEPSAGLDPSERIHLRNLLAGYAQGSRIVLLSTHIVADVESAADRVLVMKRGRLLRDGTPQALAGLARGKVWTCAVPPGEADALRARYSAASVRSEAEGMMRLRLVADECPAAGAEPAAPGLEDLYLYDFREEAEADVGASEA